MLSYRIPASAISARACLMKGNGLSRGVAVRPEPIAYEILLGGRALPMRIEALHRLS